MSTTVQVVGPGCRRCDALAAVTGQAIADLQLDATMEKITDYAEMARMGVMSTPALAVDGTVLVSGRVPQLDEVKQLLGEVR